MKPFPIHFSFNRAIGLLGLVSLIGSLPLQANTQHDDHGHDHEGDEHAEGAVQLSPDIMREFGITTGIVGPGTLQEEAVLPGEIEFNNEAVAYVTPRYAAVVTAIHARLADRVQQGQALATLESSDTLRPFELNAPFAGTVVDYNVTPGQAVDAGAPLFTVADLSTVWADLRIYQRQMGLIHEGQPIQIVAGHDSTPYSGRIAYIAPTIDEHTRTGLARVIVDNSSGEWKPGQFVKGVVTIEEHPVDLIVPRAAVLEIEGQTVVFVQDEDGFEPRPVQLGHSDSQSFQVLSGLEPGETIVLTNPISIKAELGKESFGGHHH